MKSPFSSGGRGNPQLIRETSTSPDLSPRDRDNVFRQWPFTNDNSANMRSVLNALGLVQDHLNRLRSKKGSEEGVGGWVFAKPFEYDPTKAYSRNQVVVVSPTNEAFVTGVTTGDPLEGGAITGLDGHGPNSDKALCGLFVCMKGPRVLSVDQPADPDADRNYDVHVPIWEPPNGDPDSGDNYWWLIALYPKKMTVCTESGTSLHYVNAQPVPEEFLEE